MSCVWVARHPLFDCILRYAQSKKSNLSVQVDAAINSGNRCCLCIVMTMIVSMFALAMPLLCM